MRRRAGAGEAPVLDAVRDALVAIAAERAMRARPPASPSRFPADAIRSRSSTRSRGSRPRHRIELSALHVHHGLSANADTWAAFCSAECAKREHPLVVHRARVERRGGAEPRSHGARGALRSIRRSRRRLRRARAPRRRPGRNAVAAAPARRGPQRARGDAGAARRPIGPALLRPLLALPRSAIDAYANARALAWVDDESNADTDVKRNFIRHEIAARLAAAFPGYPRRSPGAPRIRPKPRS
jgi:hypothetical protein